jgi:hypothetical protein
MPPADTQAHLFREAVSAIDSGNVSEVRRLLALHPGLASARLEGSPDWLRQHIGDAIDGLFARPYLLWFVTEDPVRHGRLPPNFLEILRLLIDAAVQAGGASLQEQLDTTLRLLSWSGVAAAAGLQVSMLGVLLDAGASSGENATNALVNGHVDAALYLISRGATLRLGAAVCLGLWGDAQGLAEGAAPEEVQFALVLSALRGNADGVEWLLARGASPNEPSAHLYPHGTPLHHAVCSGSLDTVLSLVSAGADTRRRDMAWNGSPLDWAKHYVDESDGERKAAFTGILTYLQQCN